MAKIIRHGTRAENAEAYTLVFQCQTCGCQFVLDYPTDKAYHRVVDTKLAYDDYYAAQCPECRREARSLRQIRAGDLPIS